MQPNTRLRRERQLRGWSQARVGEQIGSDAINVSRWERGFSSPSPYFREKLCLLFGMTAEQLGLLPDREPAEAVAVQTPSRRSRVVATLTYSLWWASALVAMVLARRDPFVLFHSAQAALVFGAVTLLDVVLFGLVDAVAWEGAQVALVLVALVVNVIASGCWLGGMVTAWKGIPYPFPLVGDWGLGLARALAIDPDDQE